MQSVIAAIQMCSTDIVNENLSAAKLLIAEAAKNNANMVVLPEMFAIMGKTPQDKVLVKEKFGSGLIQDFLSEQAKLNNIWIVGGTIPIECENANKVKAASLLFNAKGECVARYDKIHLFDVTLSEKETYKESDTTEAGNNLVVVDTPFGKLGLGVCYDIRFPEMFRYLFDKGAEIIILPAAFTVLTGEAHWELLARSRAVENFSYLIGAAQGGTHTNGRQTYGNSLIVDPWGTVLAKNNGVEQSIIYANIDLEKLRDIRKSIPVMQHQKIFFDVSKLAASDITYNNINYRA